MRFLRRLRVVLRRSFRRFKREDLAKVPTRRHFNFDKVARRLLRFNKARVLEVSNGRFLTHHRVSASFVRPFTFPTRFGTRFLRNRNARLTRHVMFTNHGSGVFKDVVLGGRPRALRVVLNVTPITREVRVSRVRLILVSLNCAYNDRDGLTYCRVFAATFALVIRRSTIRNGRAMAFAVILNGPRAVLLNRPVQEAKVRKDHFLLERFLCRSRRFKDQYLVGLNLLFRTRGASHFRRARHTCHVHFHYMLKCVRACFRVTLDDRVVSFVKLCDLGSACRQAAINRVPPVRVRRANLLRVAGPLIRVGVFCAANVR